MGNLYIKCPRYKVHKRMSLHENSQSSIHHVYFFAIVSRVWITIAANNKIFSFAFVHMCNLVMYVFTEMSDGSPCRRMITLPRYRWLNRKWRTRVYGVSATKLLGTFSSEREPTGMWECVASSLSVFKKSCVGNGTPLHANSLLPLSFFPLSFSFRE